MSITMLFASIPLVFANNTGSIRFYPQQSSVVPPGITKLVPADRVGTPEAREVLRQAGIDGTRMAVDVLPVGAAASADPACGAYGSDGRLELRALALQSAWSHENTMASAREFDLAGATRGYVMGPRGTTFDGRALDLSFGERVPAVQATLRIQADTVWALTDCAGRELRSWTQSDWVARSAVGRTVEDADALLDPTTLTRVEVVAAVAESTRGQLTAPKSERVDREIFDAGSPELEAAAELLHRSKYTDWDTAARIWERIAAQGDDRRSARLAAMATYDLALYEEWRGDTGAAAERARRANEVLREDWIAGYVAVLDALADADD
ncbi:MAG: DUF6340 family protein [Pseudomonadota bacterium]